MTRAEKRKRTKIEAAIAAGADWRGFVPAGLIRHVVGQYHVGTPYREIRERIDSSARLHEWTDRDRRYAIKIGLAAHHENRELYREVMRGF